MKGVIVFLLSFSILLLPIATAGYVDLSKFIERNNTTVHELGRFSSGQQQFVFWSNETKRYVTGAGSKLVIDRWAYVVDYDLDEGWIIIYSDVVEPITILDVFSGVWKKTTIHKGYNRLNFSGIGEYAGLKVVTISSPTGIAILKQRKDIFYFEDYPIVILKSELAKFGWKRAFISLLVFLFGLGIAYYFKQYYLNPQFSFHFMVLILLSVIILLSVSIDISKYSVTLSHGNQTIVKDIPILSLNTKRIKDMYNWVFVIFLWLGYIVGLKLSHLNYLNIVLAEYGRVEIRQLPYSEERKLVRDLDGGIAKVKFENGIKQYVTLNIDGNDVRAVIIVREEDRGLDIEKAEYNGKVSLVAFLSSMVVMVLADYLGVIKFDFSGALLISCLAVVLANAKALYDDMKLKVTKEKILVCSEIVNEDSYIRMLKNAEIKHYAENYNKLLRAYIREKITQPRKIISELLSVVREVREAKEGGVGHGGED